MHKRLKFLGCTTGPLTSLFSTNMAISETMMSSCNFPLSPPRYIYVADTRCFAVYVPNPLRCFNCQKFGHAQNNCKGQKVCARCASRGHDTTDCSSQLKCANCDGDHAAFSKDCPSWQREKKCSKSRRRLVCLLWRLGRLFDHRLHPEMDSPLQVETAASTKSTACKESEQLCWYTNRPDLARNNEPAPLNTFEKSVQTEPWYLACMGFPGMGISTKTLSPSWKVRKRARRSYQTGLGPHLHGVGTG